MARSVHYVTRSLSCLAIVFMYMRNRAPSDLGYIDISLSSRYKTSLVRGSYRQLPRYSDDTPEDWRVAAYEDRRPVAARRNRLRFD